MTFSARGDLILELHYSAASHCYALEKYHKSAACARALYFSRATMQGFEGGKQRKDGQMMCVVRLESLATSLYNHSNGECNPFYDVRGQSSRKLLLLAIAKYFRFSV